MSHNTLFSQPLSFDNPSSGHVLVQAEPGEDFAGATNFDYTEPDYADDNGALPLCLEVAPTPSESSNGLIYENALDILAKLHTLHSICIDFTRLGFLDANHEALNFLARANALLASKPADSLRSFEVKMFPVSPERLYTITERLFQGHVPPGLKKVRLQGCKLRLDSPILRAATITSLIIDGPSNIFVSVDDVINVLRGLPSLSDLQLGLDSLDPPTSVIAHNVSLPFVETVYLASTATAVSFLLCRLSIPISVELTLSCYCSPTLGSISVEMTQLCQALRARYAGYRQMFQALLLDLNYEVQTLGGTATGINVVLDGDSDCGALSVSILWNKDVWKQEALITALPHLPIDGADLLVLTNAPFISSEDWNHLFRKILPCSLEIVRVAGPSALCGLSMVLRNGGLPYLQSAYIDSVNFLGVEQSFSGQDLLDRFVEALQERESRRMWRLNDVELLECGWDVQMVLRIENEIPGRCSLVVEGERRTLEEYLDGM